MNILRFGNLKEVIRDTNGMFIVKDEKEDSFYNYEETLNEAKEHAERTLNVSCDYELDENIEYPVFRHYKYYLKSNHQYVGWCKIMVG